MKNRFIHLTQETLIISVFTAMCLIGCREDMPLDIDQSKNDYFVSWIKKFGIVDKSHNWSVADAVLAETAPESFGEDITICIFSTNPANGGKLIGKTSANTTLHLDVMKGSENVFVQAFDSDGCCYENNYYLIVNGTVTICNSSRASRSINNISLEGHKDFEANNAKEEIREPYNSDNPYTLTEAIEKNDTKYLWKTKIVKRTVEVDEYYSYTTYDFYFVNIYGEEFEFIGPLYSFAMPEGYSYYGGFTEEEYSTHTIFSNAYNQRLIQSAIPATVITYQSIDGIETTRDKTVKEKDLAPLFGKGGYFEEQRNPSCLEVYQNQFNPDVTFTVSGELTLDFMYGATTNSNIFGYYYWQEGENPYEAVRYILIDNATPHHNISINTASNYLTDGMALSGIFTQGNPEESEDILIGTSYKVPYFDKDGKASYSFPNGTHIAFFLIVNGMTNDSWLFNTNLSVQSHNLYFGRHFTGYSRAEDETKGEIDAISFRFNGTYYLGFEDRGGDKDMNDIVFFIRGKATPNYPVIEIGTTPDKEEWLIACEDLGSTDDYDFNDIVFSVEHVAGETAALITPLAAGGTLRAVVMYDGNPINGSEEESEIHYLVNNSNGFISGKYPMLNTYTTVNPGSPFSITVDEDFSISENLDLFSIQVEGQETSYIITSPDTGTAPQIICLPGDWLWPTERTDITAAYPLFKDWSADCTNLDWLDEDQRYENLLIVR
ncbi:MAG: DUF4114 domain-containing protein [Bacteroidales bacterium]|nr:DUF4114 domain-containing protein [Bacteroidales bacterium]